ncbi:MAG TPA: hypothetical protein VLC09_11505 [Polyangiaceae bacterium]|nr:hypothetical protein [Polyangiaceae bacterium]
MTSRFLALGSLVPLIFAAELGCSSADGDLPAGDDAGLDGVGGADAGDDTDSGAGGEGPSPCDGVVCGFHEGCVLVDGAPTCECLPGFTGDGCSEDVNECLDDSACGEGASCINATGSFACLCLDDYVRTPGGCEIIDECAANATPCASGASCSDTSDALPTCTCPAGKTGDGSFCLASDPCAGVNCNGGQCVPTPAGALCDCPLGRSGLLCQNSTGCDDIQFASDTLKVYVRATSGVIEGPLDASQLNLKNLSAAQTGGELVDDLGGLECLVSLEGLTIHGQSLTSIGPVAGLSRLESLTLTCTPVSELGPIAAAIRLRSLSLGGGGCTNAGQITSLTPLAGLTNLESLDISLQPVTSLAPLANLPALQWLVADGVTTADFSALAQLTRLRELSLNGATGFDWDDVTSLPYLRRLGANGTGLTSLDALAEKASLREISAADNALTSLAGLKFPAGLYSLDAARNDITTVAGLVIPPGTSWLNLWGNQLTNAAELLEADLPPGLELWLFENPFNCDEAVPVFEQLEARGVAVLHDCPLP